MEQFFKKIEVKWADLDSNAHLRHTAYLDYATHVRICLFRELGFTIKDLQALGLGPILFREEIKYLREVGPEDTLQVFCALSKARRDFRRFSFVHEFFRGDGVKAAHLELDGSWMDLNIRKLGIPPPELVQILDFIPKHSGFEWIA